MDNARKQLVDKLKTANNVLVTVSRNPSVDGLSALLGLSLLLNKQGKHAAAVYSGETPSTIEFLKPEDTIEKNTDSLRDFIIALDKSKADKLRYKVEDNVVRIFITPYKTSITQTDLDFSQGDFNVDLVIALGVSKQEDLDEAITTHGRILHDATVASLNIVSGAGLGTIIWNDPGASSLSELVTDLAEEVGGNLLDEQIATALLTGIVAETERFSNDKTTSDTMSASAKLMAAGANQQLVASKLEEPPLPAPVEESSKDNANEPQTEADETPPKRNDGTLEIEHSPDEASTDKADKDADLPEPALPAELPEPQDNDSDIEPDNSELAVPDLPPMNPGLSSGPRMVTEPPTLGGTLTANSSEPTLDPSTDPFSLPSTDPPKLLSRKQDKALTDSAAPPPPPPASLPPPPQAASPAVTLPSNTPSGAQLPVAPFVPPPPPPSPPPAPAPSRTPVLSGLTPPPPAWVPPPDDDGSDDLSGDSNTPQLHIDEDGTLSQLEKSVDSPHINEQEKNVDSARQEIDKALSSDPTANSLPTPIAALNAQPLGPSLHQPDPPSPQSSDKPSTKPATLDPPPVPPPIPFEFGKPPQP